eukprot:CAMPEP_0201167124 /NCGR_PEP_ID=MMETSP0851-20130426/71201_1 /ASSEMBLY_ACC=CAM_ASM_000631 /TAXON_ID=183588 /ORGANISM="Pseudo-nitzschia fraudulenta, Strain WWA7" /LENGTH=343 /DNA_ID=CAMNT_0047448283 /DNA_START=108 /DNA_END=1139 /DNA_ORIENTATION=+
MIGEIDEKLDQNVYHNNDSDDESSIPEMFRSSSGLLESLDRLTNEIKANLMSSDDPASVTGSNESSSNEDDDFYWYEDDFSGDDEDPDSGENKLCSMMDELVMELRMELRNDRAEDNDTGCKPLTDEENTVSVVNKDELTVCTAEISDDSTEENNRNTKEPDDFVGPSPVSPSPVSPSPKSIASPVSKPIQPIDDQPEKQTKLHQHVKTLLQQVTEMTRTEIPDEKTKKSDKQKNATKTKEEKIISPKIQKTMKRADSDRMVHLMGEIATNDEIRDKNTTAIASLSSSQRIRYSANIKKKTKKKRTNKHKKRKAKASIQTQQSLQILLDSLLALDEKLSREHE